MSPDGFSIYDRDITISARELLKKRAQDRGPTPDPGKPDLPPITETGGLRLHVLGSGSKGNCAVVEGPEGSVLIDCGFSKKETFARLDSLGVARASIKGILLTHEHSDHTRGVGVLARGLHVPVYATYGTAQSPSVSREVSCVPVNSRDRFEIAGFEIVSFPTSHDAREPIGFRFEIDGDALGYLTDSGIISQEAFELLYDTRILALESNHDPKMLKEGPYPYQLKVRIASEKGHLSNVQTRDALRKLLSSRLKTVVGMHLSETNNTPRVSVKTVSEAVEPHTIELHAARQNRPHSYL